MKLLKQKTKNPLKKPKHPSQWLGGAEFSLEVGLALGNREAAIPGGGEQDIAHPGKGLQRLEGDSTPV